MSSQIKLEQLFRRCDTRGNGFIDQGEFRDLCAGFNIAKEDADIIFEDLDHDGDGKISFEDFSYGFRDFLTPGSRRGSLQLGLEPSKSGPGPLFPVSRQPSLNMPTVEEAEEKIKMMERKHDEAKDAWKHFTEHLDSEDVQKFLGQSGDKLFSLYEEMQSSDAPPHLVSRFEDVLSALMQDVKRFEEENKKMEEKYFKEREDHTRHLRSIEAELDAQVARIEQQAKEKARAQYESEKRELQSRMEAEMAELQTHLKLFQKVDTWLSKEKEEVHGKEVQEKLETAFNENRNLKANLSDTQMKISLLRNELSQMRAQYEEKCSELMNERENRMEYLYEFDNIQRQLELLRGANQNLQDTNDGLQSLVDVTGLRSPRSRSRTDFSLLLPHSSSDPNLNDELRKQVGRKKKKARYPRPPLTGSRTPSEYDSDSLRSRSSVGRPKLCDVQFGIKRFMDDLDSGNSTLPTCTDDARSSPDFDIDPGEALKDLDSALPDEDASAYDDDDDDEDDEDEEGSNHLKPPRTIILKKPSPAARHRKKASLEKDREISEVATSSPPSSIDSVKERLLLQQKHAIEVTDHCKELLLQPRRPSAVGNLPRSLKISEYTLRNLEPTGPPDRTYKVVFAGDAAVGKTSFINRITKGTFLENLSSTLGVDFQVKTIRVDERNIALQLWDTAGQERFRSVTRSYFRRADGVMLLYDVTSDRSFLSVRQWIEAVDDVSETRIPIMLCANKIDLREIAKRQGTRCISTEEGEKMARQHSAVFIETSSKDGENVLDALIQLSRDMCSTEDVQVQTSALKIREDEGKKKSCCGNTKK